MNGGSEIPEFDERRKQKEYFYAVLNLPVYATDSEIRERHRALSLVFHPDRQRVDRTKDTAKEQFLEIQAAYEILSDPFLRVVYDTLGYDGLKLQFPRHIRVLPQEELRVALRDFSFETKMTELQSRINSRASVTCSVDARELLYDGWLGRDWFTDLSERLSATTLSLSSIRHTFSKCIGQQTRLQVISRLGWAGLDDEDMDFVGNTKQYVLLRGNIFGVINHQYSSTKQLRVKACLTNPRGFRLTWAHEDEMNSFRVSAPLRPTLSPPPLTITFRRCLFRDSRITGVLDYVVRPGEGAPFVNVALSKPVPARTDSWFSTGWTCGMSLSLLPGPVMFAEWHMLSGMLSTLFKFGIEHRLATGLTCKAGSVWSSKTGETDVDTEIIWNAREVVLRTKVTHLGQSLVLPVMLADTYAPGVAMLTAFVPASFVAITSYFVMRKRRAAKLQKRLSRQQAGDVHLSEGHANAIIASEMLADNARNVIQAEKDSNGLIVQEAIYFPLDGSLPVAGRGVDVTIPVQVLVHNGQLFIPGGRPKSVLRGFYDPIPGCTKRLSVRYEFRGRLHYAEFGEHAPVLLPLESHLVERVDFTNGIRKL
ncbi:hypothetical protein EW145_g6177 [Phellinidium pouzarii]|uniref:J domain-containing protein n=1 Tax=Phellinidium pouzarii TaxID=167371 RepID=A0A4S4KXN3_9AGAM|nr:hypothetical protein EW145_g6177 [Phellinidium pouzarii]